MKKTRKYAFIAGAAIGIIGAFMIFKGNDGSSSQEDTKGPEGVLSEFVGAMKMGEFDKAWNLCDTAGMENYMQTYIQKWDSLSMKDSAAFASITALLAGTELHFLGLEENDGVSTIDYCLEMDGNLNAHQATLRMEEGEWKIVAITDKH